MSKVLVSVGATAFSDALAAMERIGATEVVCEVLDANGGLRLAAGSERGAALVVELSVHSADSPAAWSLNVARTVKAVRRVSFLDIIDIELEGKLMRMVVRGSGEFHSILLHWNPIQTSTPVPAGPTEADWHWVVWEKFSRLLELAEETVHVGGDREHLVVESKGTCVSKFSAGQPFAAKVSAAVRPSDLAVISRVTRHGTEEWPIEMCFYGDGLAFRDQRAMWLIPGLRRAERCE